MTRTGPFAVVCAVLLAATVAFLLLPVAAIITNVPPRDLVDGLRDPAAREALRLSLTTSLAAVGIIVAFGTPTAWLLATRRFRGRGALITVVELPLVVPPAVAGIGLLAALGPNGLLGPALDAGGIRLVLETAGVVVALVFVASPFFVRQALAGFAAVDPALLAASRTLGAGEARTFLRVGVPLARQALGAGVALAWGRALGEFGATLLFAGSLRGVTQTAPLAIYERFSTSFTGALSLSVVLIAASVAVLSVTRLLTRGDDAPR